MPSRWFCLVIVLFWLAVNGWLFWHDLLPRLLPGQPPPYAVELVEEAKTNRAVVNWLVYLDDQAVGRARTRVEHPRRDVFELIALIKPEKIGGAISYRLLQISQIESAYRVNAAGDLLGLSAQVDAAADLPLQSPQGTFTLEGEVEAGLLTTRLRVEPTLLFPARNLEPVDAPRGGAVLFPLHPVNRLRGLTPGQYWNVHLLDTLGVCLGGLSGRSGDMSMAHAVVRAEEVRFDRGRHRDAPCLVIDYVGDDMTVTTWVARRNGLVMAQETTTSNTRWALYRE